IMFKTVLVILKKEGINAPDQLVGASRFSGSSQKDEVKY
ncbi:sugar transferase, partial [Acinetobacter baumannii]